MSSTKKTTYLDLSQFENTDKPSWLADYNKDMKKIDDAFHEIGQSSESTDVVIKHLQDEIDRGITADEYDDTATYEVDDYVMYQGKLYKCIIPVPVAEPFDSTKWQEVPAGLKVRVSKAEREINELQNQNGDSALTTDAQTLSGAINEVDAHADANAESIAGLQETVAGFESAINNANKIAYQQAQAWSSAIAYRKHDIVLYENAMYIRTGEDMAVGSDFVPSDWLSIKLGDKVSQLLRGEDIPVNANDVQFDKTAVSQVVKSDNVQGAIVDVITESQKQWLIHGMLTVAQLSAGETTITIEDDRIHADSAVDIYVGEYGVNPTGVTGAEGSVTMAFDALDHDLLVGVIPRL